MGYLSNTMQINKAIVAIACAALLSVGCAKKDGSAGRFLEGGSVEELYAKGHAALIKEKYPKAINAFRSLQSRYPYGRHAEQTQLDLAYAYFKNAEPDAALAEANSFIRLNPTHPHVDYAYYLKGLINFQEDRGLFTGFLERVNLFEGLLIPAPRSAQDSFQAFRDLVTRFPESRYAQDARQRMAYLLNVMAMHDVQIARFYFDRGAYVATVNRAKHVVEHYQQAAAVEDALGIMVEAYREMELDDLAEDTLRVLRSNFPTSRYLLQDEANG